LQKEGYRPSTIQGAIKNLKAIARHCNLLNPEAVKAYVSKAGYSENNRDKVIGDLNRFYKALGIKWYRPLSRRVEKLPFIPQESEIDNLIGGLGPKLSIFTRLVKETRSSVKRPDHVLSYAPGRTRTAKAASSFSLNQILVATEVSE